MSKWHHSLLNSSSDMDPTGRRESESSERIKRDPSSVIEAYKDNLDCLEVLARADMSGKWMVQPVPRQKRVELEWEQELGRQYSENGKRGI